MCAPSSLQLCAYTAAYSAASEAKALSKTLSYKNTRIVGSRPGSLRQMRLQSSCSTAVIWAVMQTTAPLHADTQGECHALAKAPVLYQRRRVSGARERQPGAP